MAGFWRCIGAYTNRKEKFGTPHFRFTVDGDFSRDFDLRGEFVGLKEYLLYSIKE